MKKYYILQFDNLNKNNYFRFGGYKSKYEDASKIDSREAAEELAETYHCKIYQCTIEETMVADFTLETKTV